MENLDQIHRWFQDKQLPLRGMLEHYGAIVAEIKPVCASWTLPGRSVRALHVLRCTNAVEVSSPTPWPLVQRSSCFNQPQVCKE